MKANKSGYIKVPGGRVWYGIFGKKSKEVSLVIVHGGPGYPHNYLKPLAELSRERQVIFYDQLGCGKSDRPSHTKLWTVARYIRELAQVVRSLELKNFYILGQSWGAALAVSFALSYPKGLKGLILADPYLSTHIWIQDAGKLIKSLPEKIQKIIWKYKLDGIKTKEYKKAQQLSRIKIPVLLLCGRFDEATPESCIYFKKRFKRAKIRIFEKSAHFPHLIETKEYLKTIRVFLRRSNTV